LVRDYRAARLELFASSRPGPRSEPKKDSARTMVLTLRREGRSLAEIARALTAAGTPLGRTAIWEVVSDEGLGRLPLETIVPASSLSVATPKGVSEEPCKPGRRGASWLSRHGVLRSSLELMMWAGVFPFPGIGECRQ